MTKKNWEKKPTKMSYDIKKEEEKTELCSESVTGNL